MDLIHYVVKDGVLETSNERNVSRQVRVCTINERSQLVEVSVEVSRKLHHFDSS